MGIYGTNYFIISGGFCSGYNVYYTTDKNLDDNEWTREYIPDGTQMSTAIYDMLPETTYYFKVQAINNHGDTLQMSDVVEYTHPAGKMNYVFMYTPIQLCHEYKIICTINFLTALSKLLYSNCFYFYSFFSYSYFSYFNLYYYY